MLRRRRQGYPFPVPRALPILIIVGLAIYSFFDVLQTQDGRIRRYPKTFWLVMVLVPVVGAALWFLAGRPRRSRGTYDAPGGIAPRGNRRPIAPDDDPNFLKRLDEEAWRRKRDQQRDTDAGPPPSTGSDTPPQDPPERPSDGPAPGTGPGIAPA